MLLQIFNFLIFFIKVLPWAESIFEDVHNIVCSALQILESDQIFFVGLKYSRLMHIPILYCHEVINKDIGKENWFLTGVISPLKDLELHIIWKSLTG